MFNATVRPVIGATVLLQSYPNPFNPETWIPYELEREAEVRIQIYNTNGQLVETIHSGDLSIGTHSFTWNGNFQSSGIYFARMKINNTVSTAKLMLIK